MDSVCATESMHITLKTDVLRDLIRLGSGETGMSKVVAFDQIDKVRASFATIKCKRALHINVCAEGAPYTQLNHGLCGKSCDAVLM